MSKVREGRDSGQRSVVSDQKGRGMKDDGGQRSEDRGQKSVVRGREKDRR